MPRRSAPSAQGAFYPAFDEALPRRAGLEKRHAQNPVVHPAPAQRVGELEPGQRRALGEQGLVFQKGRGLVVVELHASPAISRLPGRIGDGGDKIEPIVLGHAELRLGQDPVVPGVSPVRNAGMGGGKHHRDGHQWNAIHWLPGDQS